MDIFLDILLHFYFPLFPYLLVFGILMLCGLGIPIPEDITLFAAGLFSYYGLARLDLMIGICLMGVLLGDSMIFLLGQKYGKKLTKTWFFGKILPDKRLDMVQQKFHQFGNRLIFIARFMPGLRAPIYFFAGTLHLPFRVFFFYDGLAAVLSVPAIIWAVYFFGDELNSVIQVIQKIEHGIVFTIVGIVGFIILKNVFKAWTSRKKRS